MRIGILTQPLYCNYGGIIQCFALQTFLQRMGHDTIVLQREFHRNYTVKGACMYYVKYIMKLLMRKESSWHYYISPKRRAYIAQNTNKFIEDYINPRSPHCYSTEELKQETLSRHLDAIIVGSDQVWRPDYSPCLPNYFLDFLEKDNRIKRISYAASFGNDNWTFTDNQTSRCRRLLQRFNSVSVRESTAIKLCKEHFHVNATQVLDPTLLLEREDYESLIPQEQEKRGTLFCYFLDRNQKKKDIIKQIVERYQLKSFESMPLLPDTTYNLYEDIDKCVYPPIEEWLSAFMEADIVLTDSFHGTVFSIIFNKPFWVIGNKSRGMARFESLLSLFNLKNRLITDSELMNNDFMEPIEWNTVNEKRIALKNKSMQFIFNALN